MKRVLFLTRLAAAVLLAFLGSHAPCRAEEPEENQLYARSAVLMDADSGRILFEKQGNAVLPMASTTKIMTCILALENGNLEDWVAVSDYASSMPKVKLHMKQGESYRLLDLLYSMMLESHNDSAAAIAEHIGGSVEGFAEKMNAKAVEIGCGQTYFITPNGLDAQTEIIAAGGAKETVTHSTTAADLARIMRYCIKQSPAKEMFLEITRTPSYCFTDQSGRRSFSCSNHNAFLTMMDGALSGKTGFTGKAGYCYVGAVERDQRTFVVALLACGWPNHKNYKWEDTKKLMQYGIDNFHLRNLGDEPLSERWLRDIPVSDAKTGRLFAQASVKAAIRDTGGPPSLLLKDGEQITVRAFVKTELSAPVKKDVLVGTIEYLLDETVVWKRGIYTQEALEKADFPWFCQMVFLNFML